MDVHVPPVKAFTNLTQLYLSVSTSVQVNTLIAFLLCMPTLRKLRLEVFQLLDDILYFDRSVLLSKFLTELHLVSFSGMVLYVNSTLLLNFMSCMPALTKVLLQDVPLTGELDVNQVHLSKSIKEIGMAGYPMNERGLRVPFMQMVRFLSCFSGLENVTLWNVQLIGELDVNCVTSIKSLKKFVMRSSDAKRVLSVDMTQFARFLSCGPSLTEVVLWDISITGVLDTNHLTLSEFLIAGCLSDRVYNVNVTQLVSFLSCMPALTKMKLQDVCLTDELGDNHMTLSESLKEFLIVGCLSDRVYNVNVTQLVSFLSCMPALTKVQLWDVHLTGELDTDHVTLSESLKEFVIGGNQPACVYSVNVTQLVSFLSCMPALRKVQLWYVHLTDELGDNNVTLSESLKDFIIAGCLPDRVYNVNVTQLVSFLSCMPTLTKVELQDVYLTDELGDNHMTLSESLKEFVIAGCLSDRVYNVNVTQLVSFLSCMPALTKVQLLDVHLTDELGDNNVTLSESLQDFMIAGCLSDKVLNVNVTQMASFLSCMPALKKVRLWDVHLAGELDVKQVTLSESLKEFEMISKLPDRVYNVNVTQLVSFLRCMHALTKMELQDVYLTDELGDNHMTLSESLKEFVIAGCLSDRVYNVNVTQLVSFLSCMPTLTKVELQDVYLTDELGDNHMTLSESLKEFVIAGCLTDRVYNVNVTQLVSFLSCMPALTKVELQYVYLTDELGDNHMTLSESLKEFVIAGCLSDRVYNVNVTQLVSFLSCMPALTKVQLWDVHLTGELDTDHVTLSESLKEFVIGGNQLACVYSVNVTRLVRFLGCMPALTKIELQYAYLTDELGDNHVILSESLKDFMIAGCLPDRVYNVNVTQLVSLLSCMPTLTKVELQDVYMTGELGDNHVTLSESLKEFLIAGCLPDRVYNVNVTQLVSFLICIPTLTKVELQDVYLTDELGDNHMTLSESLKEFVIAGCLTDRVYNVNVTQLVSFLSCMPALTKVQLWDVHLTGELDTEHVTLSESLKEFVIGGNQLACVYSVNVTRLVRFLGCMPALTKIELQYAYLTDELGDNHVILSESLKDFMIAGCLPDRVYNVNVTQLVSLLSCMPTLTKVELQDVYMTGELGDNHVTLSESLKEFLIAGCLPDRVYNVNVTQLVSFLSCMPALTQVELQDVYLTGELDSKMVTFHDSVRQFSMSSHLVPDKVCNVNMMQLINLLSCFTCLENVCLLNIQLTSELEPNCMTLNESVKEVWIATSFDKVSKVNVKQLINLLSCMPSLEIAGLYGVQLTGDLDGNPVILSESLHRVYMTSCFPEKSLNVNITQLFCILSRMPSLTQVKLQNVQLTGEVRDTGVSLSETFKELWISGCNKDCPNYCGGEWCVDGENWKEKEKEEAEGDEKKKQEELENEEKDKVDHGLPHNHTQCTVNIHTLVSFLRCMQSRISLKLNRVAVLGMLDEGTTNVLPVQGFSCIDCFSNPQLLSVILAQGSAVRALQLTGVRSQFTEDDVRRIFTTDRLASLKVLKVDDSMSNSFSSTQLHIVKTCLLNLEELYLWSHDKPGQIALFDFILDCKRQSGVLPLPLQKLGIFFDIRDTFGKCMNILQYLPNLRSLDLGRCGLSKEHFQELSSSLSSLKQFEEIGISETDSVHFMPILAQTHPYICNLSSLRLRNVGLTDDRMTKIPWSDLSQLIELDLSFNKIGSEGVTILSKMVRDDRMPPLQQLNLEKNDIGSAGMSDLAKCFSHLPLMKNLNLACEMKVSPQALEDVFRNLVHLPVLEIFDLRGPHVGDEDLGEFPLLMDCCRLLNWNVITKETEIYISVEIRLINEVVKRGTQMQ